MSEQIISPNANAMPGMSGVGGIINGQDPNYLYSVMQAQRQKMLADALTQDSLSPINYDHAGAISPLQGLAKMLQAYAGKTGASDANQSMADLQSQAMQRTALAYGLGSPPQTQQGPQGADPAAPASSGGPSPQSLASALSPQSGPGNVPRGTVSTLNPYGAPNMLVLGAANGDPASKAMLDQWLKDNGPTESMKNNQWMGYTPGMALQGKIAADIKGGDMEHKSGNQWANAYTGQTGYAPKIPDNSQPGSIGPNGQIIGGVSEVPGAIPIEAKTAGAVKGAESANTVGMATGPNGAQVPVWQGPAANAGTTQLGLGGSSAQPGSSAAPTWTGTQLSPQGLNQLKASAAAGAPEAKAALAAYSAKFSGDQNQGGQPTTPQLGADPTIQTARTNQQTALAEKWKPLNEAVSNAATVNSRLDTIRDLATKASTGQFADKMQFVNSLLSMAGSEKATDSNTAKVLLDKNANQIVAQLGQGGLATDAARAIIGSAYPNSHMPQAAIEEASNNLKAANNMMVAKAQVLMPHYLASDPVAYQKREQEFNQVADPRIFQWDAMKGNPKAQGSFAAKLMQQDPTIIDRIHALEQMGALKK